MARCALKNALARAVPTTTITWSQSAGLGKTSNINFKVAASNIRRDAIAKKVIAKRSIVNVSTQGWPVGHCADARIA